MIVKPIQLVFGAMIAFSAGGLATYETMIHVAMTCTPQSDQEMKDFLKGEPYPMTDGGKRY